MTIIGSLVTHKEWPGIWRVTGAWHEDGAPDLRVRLRCWSGPAKCVYDCTTDYAKCAVYLPSNPGPR